jgi:DHA1 family bicyclomycin/chloramphenicol resistance-like MFS transporter
MQEPLETFSRVSPLNVLRVYLQLLGNRRFTGLMLAMSVLVIPFFSFIAGSSEIYMSVFGLDERVFGYFFGFNALAAMSGPMAFSFFSRHISSKKMITAAFSGIMAAGAWMLAVPHNGPWSLALPMWVLSFFMGLSRPMTNNLILEQVDRNTGAAAS